MNAGAPEFAVIQRVANSCGIPEHEDYRNALVMATHWLLNHAFGFGYEDVLELSAVMTHRATHGAVRADWFLDVDLRTRAYAASFRIDPPGMNGNRVVAAQVDWRST